MGPYTFSFRITAEIGRYAEESCLAMHMMSGRMPKVSHAKRLPVRKKPVMTSSATISTSCFSSTAWIFSK